MQSTHNQLIRPIGAVVACASLLLPTFAGGAEDRPNFVVILVDDLRCDALHCTGHAFASTPNIDRLAAEGAIFRNAFATTPLCLPSRASILTGLYAHSHRVTFGAPASDPGNHLPTFPRALQKGGYDTAFIGKWHIGLESFPRPGFNHWISFRDQGQYQNPVINIDGETVKQAGYMTDILTDRASDFIAQPRKVPFLLFLSHKGVHAPFEPAKRHQYQYRSQSIVNSVSTNDSSQDKPILRRPGVVLRRDGTDPDVETTDEMIRNQLRCLSSIDDSVGRIIQQLQQLNQLDNTFIVFTSDNGYFWGEHGLGGKHGPYEEAIRVPLILRYPKLIRPGRYFDSMVLNIDLAPTILDLADVRALAEPQGASMVSLLNSGDGVAWRKSFLAEFQLNPGSTPRFPTWRAVRTERWKYIQYPEFPNMDELYDLSSDPHEITNLINRSAAKDIHRELKAQLLQLMTESNDPLVKH